MTGSSRILPGSLQVNDQPQQNSRGRFTGAEVRVRRQEWFLDDLPWKLQAVWCPMARADEGARRLLVAEAIAEGVGNYLYSTLGLRPASASFYFLPRTPTSDEIRFFGFSAEGGMPYVIELIRTASVASDDSPRPLYVAVGIYAGDRNRFESFRSAPSGQIWTISPSRTVQ